MERETLREIQNELKNINEKLNSINQKLDENDEKNVPIFFVILKSLLVGMFIVGPVIAVIYGVLILIGVL